MAIIQADGKATHAALEAFIARHCGFAWVMTIPCVLGNVLANGMFLMYDLQSRFVEACLMSLQHACVHPIACDGFSQTVPSLAWIQISPYVLKIVLSSGMLLVWSLQNGFIHVWSLYAEHCACQPSASDLGLAK